MSRNQVVKARDCGTHEEGFIEVGMASWFAYMELSAQCSLAPRDACWKPLWKALRMIMSCGGRVDVRDSKGETPGTD